MEASPTRAIVDNPHLARLFRTSAGSSNDATLAPSFVEDVSRELNFALHSAHARAAYDALSRPDKVAPWRRVVVDTFFGGDSRQNVIERAAGVLDVFITEIQDCFCAVYHTAALHRAARKYYGFSAPDIVLLGHPALLAVRLVLVRTDKHDAVLNAIPAARPPNGFGDYGNDWAAAAADVDAVAARAAEQLVLNTCTIYDRARAGDTKTSISMSYDVCATVSPCMREGFRSILDWLLAALNVGALILSEGGDPSRMTHGKSLGNRNCYADHVRVTLLGKPYARGWARDVPAQPESTTLEFGFTHQQGCAHRSTSFAKQFNTDPLNLQAICATCNALVRVWQ